MKEKEEREEGRKEGRKRERKGQGMRKREEEEMF